ncbi:MAG: hypothetical protein ACLQVK_19430 [Acidimicrobiales bacterium]
MGRGCGDVAERTWGQSEDVRMSDELVGDEIARAITDAVRQPA